MSKLKKVKADLQSLKTDAQIVNYWEHNHSRVLERINNSESDWEVATDVIYQFAKSLNDREQYSAVYYLYKVGYLKVEKHLIQSNELNELKYELGKGLHHNRKYKHSNRLFNELGDVGFDISRLEGWWDQSAFGSSREKYWYKAELLPGLITLLITLIYIYLVSKTEEFIISTISFVLLMELFETWRYKYKISIYLKEYEHQNEVKEIERKIKKKLLLELLLSLIFYPIYLINQDWLIPVVIALGAYFQIFNYWLNDHYLPQLIGDINRRKHLSKENQ
ncbi:hypothetical protein MY04_2383 [Flammeovirga sp. MY04]|uniref:hypothetical protein n=1 Tax=Flammeovirga sp. MY04 TaxID=1191459 RepID=UPI00080633D2|nr:hypothetical protein [Flammeovirga sp. MY04]ANQ49755.1 hypothetical protein MY04_2383 [Flammeovirga sp. MY04]